VGIKQHPRAFPGHNDSDKYYNWVNKGMETRQLIAAFAVQGLLAKEGASLHPMAIAEYACSVANGIIDTFAEETD
jgi:hypothetical protein